MTTDRPAPPQQRPRRPLLMDPARAQQSGFAPPTAHEPAQPPAGPLFTPSLLAAQPPAPAAHEPAESAFGPVSEVVRLSVRTVSARLDLVLPDRCTIAETLETALELSPPALREQAIARGGWTLRGADGRDLPGTATLLDLGITDGSTLLLLGLDTATTVPVYDDVADAVADTVAGDPSAWPPRAGRAVAIGAAGLLAAVGLALLLLAGPPWLAVTLALAGATVAAQVAAGLLSRGAGDGGVALTLGLVSVGTGAAAATVATGGSARLLDLGAPQLLLGAAGALLCATTAALVVGARRVAMIAIVAGAAIVGIGAACAVLFDLPPAGSAAIVAGLCLALLPVVPSAAMRMARFAVPPLPAGADQVHADETSVDPGAVAARTRTAVGYLTGLVQGLSWPALGAAIVLALAGDVTAQVLAGVTAAALLLRARLFVTIGQRLPLLVAGLGSAVALLIGVALDLTGGAVVWVAASSALGVLACLALAMRGRAVSPATRRVGDILDVLLAVAMVPLVAAVLGLFGLVRGLGG